MAEKNYWIARLKEEGVIMGLSWQYAKGMEEGLENGEGEGIYSSFYRYNENKRDAEVTKYFKAVKEVNEGDVFLIAYENRIFAHCVVEKHKFKSEQKWSIEKILNREAHDYNTDVVVFCDSDVFFEDYRNAAQNWRQCIKVKGFCAGDNKSSVTTGGVMKNFVSGNPQNTLFKVKPEFAKEKIEKLKQQYEAKNKNK